MRCASRKASSSFSSSGVGRGALELARRSGASARRAPHGTRPCGSRGRRASGRRRGRRRLLRRQRKQNESQRETTKLHAALSFLIGRTLRAATISRDFLGDEARGDRRAVVVQDRDQARRVDAGVVDQQGLELRVAVLLDHEHLGVRGDEVEQLVAEREAADAQRVDVDVLVGQRFQRFVHRRAGGAVVDAAEARRHLGRASGWAWEPASSRARTSSAGAACCRRSPGRPRSSPPAGCARCRA